MAGMSNWPYFFSFDVVCVASPVIKVNKQVYGNVRHCRDHRNKKTVKQGRSSTSAAIVIPTLVTAVLSLLGIAYPLV